MSETAKIKLFVAVIAGLFLVSAITRFNKSEEEWDKSMAEIQEFCLEDAPITYIDGKDIREYQRELCFRIQLRERDLYDEYKKRYWDKE